MPVITRILAFFVAALSAVLAVGCASTSMDSSGRYVADTALTTKVQAALFNEPSLNSDEIKVETYKGVVHLSGFVTSTAAENKAVAVARGVAGVKSVRYDTRLKY